MNKEVSASIVLYNNDKTDIERVVSYVFDSCPLSTLYLIDNSITDKLKRITLLNPYIVYHHNNTNIGFGKAHNIAINLAYEKGSRYHFIINPDVYFGKEVMLKMLKYLEADSEVAMVMPKILNEDGSIQYLPKLLPSPYSVLRRKIKWPPKCYEKFIQNYELRYVENDSIYVAPILSGCFTLFRTKVLKEIGGYDDRFFMYFEDWDLSRRIHEKYKTVYFPHVSVIHGYESGANKNSKLFKIFVQSAIQYFNKWGWFFDKDRNRINQETLNQFKTDNTF